MAEPCDYCGQLAEDEDLEIVLRESEFRGFALKKLCEVGDLLTDLVEAGGGATAVSLANESIVAVAASNTSVLAANSSRKGGWVKNISDTPIYVSLSATATTSKPTLLDSGQSLTIPASYIGAVSAIHAGVGTKNLEVVELEA